MRRSDPKGCNGLKNATGMSLLLGANALLVCRASVDVGRHGRTQALCRKKVGYSIYEQALRFTNNTLKSVNKPSKASIHTTGPVIERITQVLITFAVQKVVWGTSLWRTTLRSQTVGKEAMQIRQHTFYTSSTRHHHPCVSRVSSALDFVQTLLLSSVENCVTEDKFLFLFCKSTK